MARGALTASVATAALVVAALLVSARSEASTSPQLSQLVGFVDSRLVRVDSSRLEPLPGQGIPIGSGGCAARQGGTACWTVPPWTVSPDGTRLAVARNGLSSVRLVDAGRMRVTADIRLEGGAVGALAWFSGGRMLAVQEAAAERQRLLAVDLARKRVTLRRALGGSVVQLGRTPRELVILLAPGRSIGATTLAVADAHGAVRSVRLERILAGFKLLQPGPEHRVDSRVPGLAIDPRGRRAFVVGTALAAEVDLKSLTVSYHTLTRSASMLDRTPGSARPAAPAKQVNGYFRAAEWLGNELLAVSGSDTAQARGTPLGLLFVDTRSWNVKTIDRGSTGFVTAGNLVLAIGEGDGVTAYGVGGEHRFQLFDGESVWPAQIYGGRAYIGGSGPEAALQIVDLTTGRVVGRRSSSLPWLVQGVAQGWWES